MSLEDITDTETTVVVTSSSPPDAAAPQEREDEIDEDRAYFAPRIVPKAAIPVETDAAKVVINLPTDAEEITQAMDKTAFDQRVRDERAALARRREPTVRIPRKDVQAVRNEIAAAERAGGTADIASEIPVYFEAPSSPVAASTSRVAERGRRENVDRSIDLEASPPRRGSSKVGVVVAFLVAAVAAAGGAAWYFTQQRSTASGATETNASAQPESPGVTSSAKDPAVPSSAPRAIETASPALELSGAPAASTDPSVVTLNAAAAQGSSRPGSHPTTAPPVTGAHPLPTTGPKPISTPYQPPAHLPTKPPVGKPGYPTEI